MLLDKGSRYVRSRMGEQLLTLSELALRRVNAASGRDDQVTQGSMHMPIRRMFSTLTAPSASRKVKGLLTSLSASCHASVARHHGASPCSGSANHREVKDRACEAVGYRLSGDVVDQVCCRHLYGQDGMLVAWPAKDRAVVLPVARDDGSGADVYRQSAGGARDHGAG